MPAVILKYFHLQPTWVPGEEGPAADILETRGEANYLSFDGKIILGIVDMGSGDIVITRST